MPERVARGTGLLVWFGLAGGLAAWTLQLWISWGVEEVTCSAGSKTNDVFGVDPDVLIAIVSAAGAAASALAAAAAFTRWRAIKGTGEDPRGRIAFMAFVGVAGSLLFLWLIALGGLQLVSLRSCVPG